MKKIIFGFILMMFSIIASASCINNGVTIVNCDEILGPNGEDVNVHLQWKKPTHRENEDILDPSEIGGYLIFENTSGDDLNPLYTQIHDVTNGMHENVSLYMAPGSHTVVLVTYDQQVRTSADSAQVKLSLEGVTLPPRNATGFILKVIGTKYIEIP